MRSRTMLRRLDRIAPMAEEPLPDLSVLLPSEYDRFMDLAKADSLSDAELQEAEALLGKCPTHLKVTRFWYPKSLEYSKIIGGHRGDPTAPIRLSGSVSLDYAPGTWEEGISRLKSRMVPLDEWHPDDRAEIKSLLDLADSRNEERRGKIWGLPAP